MSWAEEAAALWEAQDETDRRRLRFFEVTVTAVNTVASTFDAAIVGAVNGQDLTGIPIAHPHFTPDVGDLTMIEVSGAQPIHRPLGIGQNAIDDRELAAEVVLATTAFIAGDPTGDHVIIDGVSGVVAYADDPVDGIPNEVARFGRHSGTTSSVTGQRTSTVDEEGNATYASLAVQTLTVGGVDFSSMFSQFARGLLTFWDDGKIQAGIVLEFGLLETGYQLAAGRNYRIHVNWFGQSAGTNDGEVVLRVRQTTNGSQPTTSSTIIAERPYTMRVGSRNEHRFFDVNFQVPAGAGAQYRWLLTLTRGSGQTTGTVESAFTPASMHLFDDGPLVLEAGVNDNTGSGSTGTTPKVRSVYSAQAAWSRSFKGDGTIRTDTTNMVQGYKSINGDGKAMVGWPDLTTTLSGATIVSARVYLHNYSWYYNAGGTLILGTHSQTAAPASFSGTSNRMTVAYGPGPSGKWIDVTSWASEFAAGTTRGFVLGPSGGTNNTYYGRFRGATDTAQPDQRPKLEIVYYK